MVQADGTLSSLGSGSVSPDDPDGSLLGRIETLELKSHTHTNKTVLDIITEEMMNQWNSAADALFGADAECRLVKGSVAVNGVSIADDGTMSVNDINVLKVIQDDGDEIIICSSLTI